MTDNVFITGAADGAFVDALNGLPPWATENTANKIADILQKSYNLQAKTLINLANKANTSGLSPEDTKKANDELDKLTKNFKDENKQHDKDKDFYNKTNKQRLLDQKNWKDSNAGFLRNAAVGALLEKTALAIDSTFKSSFETYTNLNAAGIDLISGFDKANNGFQSLSQLSSLTGVRFTELQATMLKYNTAVNAFTAFKFAKTVGIASKGLAEFGYSSKESAELLGAYLESQRGFADNRNKSEEEVAKDLVGFGKRINDVSIATGQLRGQILENLDALSHSVKATVLTGQVGEEASEKLLEFAASFKDQKLGNEFLAMMTDAIKPLNETFQHLQRAGDGAFGQMEMQFVQRLKASGASPEEMQKQTAEWVSANKAGIQQMIQRNNLLAQAGNVDAAAANEHLNLLLQQEKTYHSLSESDRARIAATNKSRADFSDAWERFLSSFQRIFSIMLPALNALSTGLNWLSDGIDKAASIINWIGDTLFLPIIHGLQSIGNLLGITSDKIESIHLTSIIGIVAAGMLGLAGIIKLLGGSLTGFVKGIFGAGGKGGGFGSSGGKGGGSNLLSGIGKGIGDIGKGIGTGLGGLVKGFLTGLADGLKALGDPKVLLGVVSLAGIAGALWIAGKAVQQFTGVSWKDLSKAGVALTGLIAAGYALGASAPEMIIGAIGLGILSGALWITGKALQQFNSVSWDGIEKAGVAIVGLIAAGYALGASAPEMIIGALGLGILGGALWITGKALQQFVGISWNDMAKAGVAIVGLGLAGAAAGAAAPLIALGALALAGMGAAMWVIGQAFQAVGPGLKMTADGIQEFGKIDGNNLIAVAQGLIALSGALVIFSASSLAGSASNMLSSLGDGFSKLLGSGSLISQLQSFAAIGPGLVQAGTGINMLSNSISSLGNSLSTLSGVDKIRDIVSAVNDLNLLKATALGVLSATGIISSSTSNSPTASNVTSPTTPVPSNLDSPSKVSTSEPANANQGVSTVSSAPPAAVSTPSNDLVSELKYQNSLTEHLLEKLSDLISVNKDILRYSRANS